jgi:NSS family neurotransmitter:Na+ symporter
MVLPAVFAFGLDPAAGPGLTFVTLPHVFSQMPGGIFFGPLFFLLLAIAALTSAVSLLEVVTAYFVDELGMSRKKVTIMAGAVGFLLCIPSSLSLGVWSDYTIFGKGFLDLMDFLATNIRLAVWRLPCSWAGLCRKPWLWIWSMAIRSMKPLPKFGWSLSDSSARSAFSS